jgi:voltage-gated potassium channel
MTEESKIKKNPTAKKLRRKLELGVYTPYYVLKQVRTQLILLGSMFLIGAFIFMWYQGLDFLTAILGSVSTITTIGIYAPNIALMDNVEKLLLIIVFIVSVGLAASVLQGTVSAAIKRGLLTDELIRRMAKGMEDHVIVVGYKFLGKYVVESLQKLGRDFLVIAKDPTQLDTLRSHGIPALYAPVTHVYEALEEANVGHASTVVSTMDKDVENMLTVLAAKKLNSKIKAISIVNDRDLVPEVRDAGADTVIPYFDIMGRMLALASVSKEAAGILFTDRLKSRHVVQFKIETSAITYGDIKGICPVLMVSRGGEFTYDLRDDLQLREGDIIYVLVDAVSVKTFRDKLRSLGVLTPPNASVS